ncbi:carboxylesterase family protein [Amylocarpus encephaloides]|uniref:Carboxylic ester hydrolase n=1 Tax=Amylocarpus encephaloides TaxID=45428 RepID=A0A9P7Y7M9_9HELO|nr:carboxylesterase family protein [Amylocarpus encephaloides]
MLFNFNFTLLAALWSTLSGLVLAVDSNSATSLTLLYQNNLNGSDDANHIGILLLDNFSNKDGAAACNSVGEQLLTRKAAESHRDDIFQSLSYVASSEKKFPLQLYHISEGVLVIDQVLGTLTFPTLPYQYFDLRVICSQSSDGPQENGTSVGQLSISSGGNNYIGYRNKKSFQFRGIPFADPPERFVHSRPYSPKGKTIKATAYGSQCAQVDSGSEDCLFLNIQTPYIPKRDSKPRLRPVLFWIHGGGFSAGSSTDRRSDGGDLASREDVVVVSINYRLSTLGFLAIPGTNVTGNYGIGDQITALQWTIDNIASFGGDPKKITIIGASAGATAVRILLGSPQAIGKFQGAIAWSNPGGGLSLGIETSPIALFSINLSIQESYEISGQNIFQEAGCNQKVLEDQITCLKAIPALKLVGLPHVAQFAVQDGHYVTVRNLNVNSRNGSTAQVPVIFGMLSDEGASFSTYPKQPVTSHLQGIQESLGISAPYAQSIIDSGLFPYYDTGNLTLDSFNVSQRVESDLIMRCTSQATVYAASQSGAFSSSYYYQLQRSINVIEATHDPNKLGGPPATPDFPNGNPNLPYFKIHGGGLPWVFGNAPFIRDDNDLHSIQLTTGYFASFVKTGDPNPDLPYLQSRGYSKTVEGIEKSGPWEKVSGEDGKIKLLDYPSTTSPFIDVPQCAFLNYSLSYYVDGGV